MASFLNRLAKLEKKRLNRRQQRRIVTLVSDEGQSLEQLQQEWMASNEPDKSASDIDWIFITLVGAP
jgi:hypothetical protein